MFSKYTRGSSVGSIGKFGNSNQEGFFHSVRKNEAKCLLSEDHLRFNVLPTCQR